MSSFLKVSPNVIVCANQPDEFVTAVKEAITEIASGEVGKRLLAKISKATHVVALGRPCVL